MFICAIKCILNILNAEFSRVCVTPFNVFKRIEKQCCCNTTHNIHPWSQHSWHILPCDNGVSTKVIVLCVWYLQTCLSRNHSEWEVIKSGILLPCYSIYSVKAMDLYAITLTWILGCKNAIRAFLRQIFWSNKLCTQLLRLSLSDCWRFLGNSWVISS